MAIHPDFLAVRKIPLKRRPYLTDNATEPDSDGARQGSSGESIDNSGKPIDPAVHKMLTLIRRKVLSDRSLHDQASHLAYTVAVVSSVCLDWRFAYFGCLPFVGRGGVRFVYQGLFEARSIVYFPDQETRFYRGRTIIWAPETSENA